MIEELIKDNTAAVKALTEAVRGLTAALQAAGSSPVAPASASAPAQERVIPPGYGPASQAEAHAAVAHADGLTAGEAIIDEPVAPAPSPVPVPVPAPAPAPADVQAPQVAVPENLEGMRALCIKAGELGLTADIVAFLRGRNVSMLRDLPQADWGALVSFLKSKGVQ